MRIVVTNYIQHFTKYSSLKVKSIRKQNELGTFSVKLDVTDQYPIFWIRQILEKSGSMMGQYISYLWVLRRPITEVLYNILIECGTPMKLIRINKIRVKETYSTRMYPKVSKLAAWSENCEWYGSLPLGTAVLLLCESV
jgi:hypothetical protein